MRIRPLWVWRVLLLGFALAYLASATLQLWVPPLVPFLAAAAVEAQFFFAGARSSGERPATCDAGPQPHDLAELGWAGRTVAVSHGDAELVLRPGALDDEAIGEWLELHRAELDELGPGLHELAPISGAASPVAPYSRPPAPPARSSVARRLLPAVVVLALVGAAVFADTRSEHWQRLPAGRRAATVLLLEREATRVARHPATVICDTSGRRVGYVHDADGLAEVGGRRMWLTPQICYSLYRVRHTGRAGAGAGHAIAVLGHEAWHLHGEANEAITNCYAYQSGVGIAEALGLSRRTARALMHRQLAENPVDFASEPQYIVPHECRRGGKLDLHLDGSSFP